jgi:hypothetical protein
MDILHASRERGPATPESLLDDRAVDAIARRVVQLLQDCPAQSRLVSAAEIAKRFAVSRQWVYGNASRLGAVRLGNGARPRLRFDPQRVEEALRTEHGRAAPRWQSPAEGIGQIDEADLIPLRTL